MCFGFGEYFFFFFLEMLISCFRFSKPEKGLFNFDSTDGRKFETRNLINNR